MINKPELTSIGQEKATNIEQEKATYVEFNTSIFEKTPRKSFINKISHGLKKVFSSKKHSQLAPDFNFMPEQKQAPGVECALYYDYSSTMLKASNFIMHAGVFTIFYSFVLHLLGFASYQDQLMLLSKPEASGISLMIFGLVHASFMIYKAFSEKKTHRDNKLTVFNTIWAPFNFIFISFFFLPLQGGSSLFIDFTKIMINLTSKIF